MFEGDIVWTKELKAAIGEMRARASGGMSPFDAITNGAWPNGVVPYKFRSGFGQISCVRSRLRKTFCKILEPHFTKVDSNAGILAIFLQTLRRAILVILQGRIPTEFLLNSYVADIKN